MQQLFSKEDFKNLSFDVLAINDNTQLLKLVPSFGALPSFTAVALSDRVDKVKLIKYVVLMYDKNTPLVKKFQTLSERKKNAFYLAGYDISEVEIFAELSDFTGATLSDMVTEFLRYQNNYTWSMLVSNEQTFYEYQKALLSETLMIKNDKDKLGATVIKSKLMEDSDVIHERIQRYYKAIFIEDKIIDYAKHKGFSPEEQV